MLNQVSDTTTDKLILADITDTDTNEWTRALQETNDAWCERTLFRFSDARLTLEEEPRTYVVLTYTSPVEKIAGDLEQGSAPSDALIRWQEFAERLINLHHTYPTRLLVVEARNGRPAIDKLEERIHRHTGLILEDLNHVSSLAQVAKTGPEMTTELQVAAKLLLKMSRADELMAQLADISVSTTVQPLASDLIELFIDECKKRTETAKAAADQMSEHDEQSSKINALEEENLLVIEQLHKSQEALERHIGKEQALLSKQKWLRAKIERKETEVTTLQETITDHETQLQTQQQKLSWLRSIRDRHRQTARDLRGAIRERDDEIQCLRGELDNLAEDLRLAEGKTKAIQSSRSWRYTKVIRNLKRR